MSAFPLNQFPAGTRDAARAVWTWHSNSSERDWTETSLAALDEELHAQDPPAGEWKAAIRAVDALKADRFVLSDRAAALHELHGGGGPSEGRDASQFVGRYAGGTAELLCRALGYRGSWQIRAARRFGEGLAMIDNLVHMPEQAARGRVLIPRSELTAAGLSNDALAGNAMPASYPKVAWKQSIRAREALTGALDLVPDMSRRHRWMMRRISLEALEWVYALDRVSFDVWRQPLQLSSLSSFRVLIQSIFGQTGFKDK